VKMRGTIKPDPVYPQDIPGLLAWLNQPPSQWSAVGWQNAPAWTARIVDLIEDLREAEAERDEARRAWIMHYCATGVDAARVDMDPNRTVRSHEAEEAWRRGWNCFKNSVVQT
jgi:hypothetical protein